MGNLYIIEFLRLRCCIFLKIVIMYIVLTNATIYQSQKEFADWVNKGFSIEAVNYDSFVLPRFLNKSSLPSINCKHNNILLNTTILILGDSVNRYMLDECNTIDGSLIEFGVGFTYNAGASAAKACVTSTGIIAFVNIYGSKLQGPYLKNHRNSPNDQWADTELRIAHAITQFKERFGSPLMIIFRAELWDLHIWFSLDCPDCENFEFRRKFLNVPSNLTTNDRDKIFSQYIENYRLCFKTIRAAAPHSLLATHSVPLVKWTPNILRRLHLQYQNAIRNFADEEKLIMYDFFQLTLPLRLQEDGAAGSDVVLRDVHHPNIQHTRAMLRIVYISLQHWSRHCQLNH